MSESTDLTTLDAELAADAKQIATALGSFPTISTKGGRFTFPDGHVEKGPMSMVIIAVRVAKQLWKLPYDPKNSASDNGIVCAAISNAALDYSMSPFDSAPERKANDCSKCPENKWTKSASGIRVKTGNCKDGPIFIVMAPDGEDPNAYILRGSALTLKPMRAAIAEAKAKFGHPVKTIFTFDSVPTPQGAQRLDVEVEGPNPKWAFHGTKLHHAVNMLESQPRWYDPEDGKDPEYNPDDEPKGTVSGGRKKRSAATTVGKGDVLDAVAEEDIPF